MKKKKGFTLLELMIAMGIISFIMAGVFMAFGIALKLFADEMTRTDIFIEADRGMSRMVRELREAKEITAASSREMTFWYADLNNNGTREPSELATYRWSGSAESTLNRIVSGETFPLSYGVFRFALTYDDPADVKLVNIALTVGKGETRATLESSVRPRNL
jgi:prepilin-type N-terminal cleavage/methylation domain-containing protein